MRINEEQEEKNNGAYGSKSQSRYRLDKWDTFKGDRSFNPSNVRNGMYGNHSSSLSRRNYHHDHHHHRYRSGEYLLEKFKKFSPPKFDGEMKKSKDAEA